MKYKGLSLTLCGLLSACAGDNHVTNQSAAEPVRHAERGSAGDSINRAGPQGKFNPGRVYLITRLQTADQPRGEWRAQGATIREHGSDIEFVELGSGKTVSFTAPHQITPMDSRTDRQLVQPTGDPQTAPESAALYP